MQPVIGITVDMDSERCFVRPGYALAIERAGGLPVLLAPSVTLIPQYLSRCAAFVLTGGDDPIMEQWGIATHPKATKVHPARQAFELALLTELETRPAVPVLGICLGMQLMSLCAGGVLEQHLPDVDSDAAARHWGRRLHDVEGDLGAGQVVSHHRQVITDPGRLQVCANAADGIIEAVRDPVRAFYLGVQWHPERTEDLSLGSAIFRSFVGASRTRR